MDIANHSVVRVHTTYVRRNSAKAGVALHLESLKKKQRDHVLYVFEVINSVGTIQSTFFARSLCPLFGFFESKTKDIINNVLFCL